MWNNCKKFWKEEVIIVEKRLITIISIVIIGFSIYGFIELISPLEKLKIILNWVFELKREDWDSILSVIIAFIASSIAYKQWKISRTALEQNRPKFEIYSVRSNETNKYIPHLEIKNTGNGEGIIEGIFYKEQGEKFIEDKKSKNIFINQKDSYFLQLTNADRAKIYSVLVFYRNFQSGRVYLLGNNINFMMDEKSHIARPLSNGSKDFLPLDYTSFTSIIRHIAKNPYKKIKIQEILNSSL